MNSIGLGRRLVAGSLIVLSVLFGHLASSSRILFAQPASGTMNHLVRPGDSWRALEWQNGIPEEAILRANRHINPGRLPTIGTEIVIPGALSDSGSLGTLTRPSNLGMVEIAAIRRSNPWTLSILNDIRSPYSPLLSRALFIPDTSSIPRELPASFLSLDLAFNRILPGEAIGFKAQLISAETVVAALDDVPFVVISSDNKVVGLTGTGAFFPAGIHEITITTKGSAPWQQSLKVQPGEWTYEQINLTGSAAAIDQASIQEEWEHLSAIWSDITPEIRWLGSFRLPIDSFLEYSSLYGAHRSYNGGPYRSYHEGLDFAAYGGTPVLAPAAGTVVVAESLYVRGGAVIIDHGYGVFSGLYHMSEIVVQPGEHVEQGQEIGRVGSTGLSTGNHLHWDFLVNGIQVDPLSWLEKDLGCWVLEGIGNSCV